MDKKILGTGKISVTFWNDRTTYAKSNIPDPLQYPWPVPFLYARDGRKNTKKPE
jgi:hypothetical protein